MFQIVFGLFLLTVIAVVEPAATPNSAKLVNNTIKAKTDLETVSSSVNKFSNELYKTTAQRNSKLNVAISPVGLSMVMSMVAHGAGGNTKTELENVLHISTANNSTKDGFQSLIKSYKAVKDLKLENGIFMQNNSNLKPAFKDVVEKNFQATWQFVDFADLNESAKTINTWFKKIIQKDGDIVHPGNLQESSLVLMSAVSYTGKWTPSFSTKLKNESFSLANKTKVSIQMMNIIGELNSGQIGSGIQAKYFELPYENEKVSMFIIVPLHTDLESIEKNIQKINFTELNKFKEPFNLTFPTFSVMSKIEFKNITKQMNITDVFENTADLSGINDQKLKITQMMQKVFISVSEQEKKSAKAVNDEENISKFIVNKPFICAIVLKETGVPVVFARVVDPRIKDSYIEIPPEKLPQPKGSTPTPASTQPTGITQVTVTTASTTTVKPENGSTITPNSTDTNHGSTTLNSCGGSYFFLIVLSTFMLKASSLVF